MEIKEKTCENPKCNNTYFPTTSIGNNYKFCSLKCTLEATKGKQQNGKRKRIKRYVKPNMVSEKQKKLIARYHKIRLDYLAQPENKKCPVTGQLTTEIHHKKGRKGYADEWAREHDIPLLVDKRFFLAVSRDGHVKIEKNPQWAYDNGYSVLRTV